MKNLRNAARGRQAKLVGDLHEGWVEQQLMKAVHLGIVAHYYHNQPTAKFVGGKWVLTQPGVSDYTGVLEREHDRGGVYAARTLAVEAKSVEGDRFYRDGVTKEQQDHLEATARAGGLALLVVCFRQVSAGQPTFMRFAIPWLEVPWQKLRSAESISWQMPEMMHWLVQINECFLLRWHSGGKRSGDWLPPGQRRVYPVE